MKKRLIWVEGHDFTGWCCSHCTLGITAPHLESTVAALAFNCLAQDTFEKHICAEKLDTIGKFESAGGSRLFHNILLGIHSLSTAKNVFALVGYSPFDTVGKSS